MNILKTEQSESEKIMPQMESMMPYLSALIKGGMVPGYHGPIIIDEWVVDRFLEQHDAFYTGVVADPNIHFFQTEGGGEVTVYAFSRFLAKLEFAKGIIEDETEDNEDNDEDS